jgi:hypothetical protein
MSSSKKRDFAAGVYLSEAQNPILPPPFTHCIRVLIYSHKVRGRGRIEPERRLEGQ